MSDARTVEYSPDEVEFLEDNAIAHYRLKTPVRSGGKWQLQVRCYGRLKMHGDEYTWNEVKYVTLKKEARKVSKK